MTICTPSFSSFLGLSATGFHRIAYTVWASGHTVDVPVICAHGLTRNGRDFDRLASVLGKNTTVYCPDVVGRGQSEWLKNPAGYNYAQYLADMTALIARTGAPQVDWVGTSMGGLIGMMLAAQPNSPIRKLVINDVGPVIPLAGLKRIADYVGLQPEFSDVEAAERYLRKNYAPFGINHDDDWRHMATHSVRTLPNGKLTLAHDPGIALNFQTLTEDVNLWPAYDAIKCPTLVLRGAQSDIFAADTAQQMTERGAKAQLVTFPNVGHAPALMEPEQIDVVKAFLS